MHFPTNFCHRKGAERFKRYCSRVISEITVLDCKGHYVVQITRYLTVVRKGGGGGLNGVFDSPTENFARQRIQSTNSTETEFC